MSASRDFTLLTGFDFSKSGDYQTDVYTIEEDPQFYQATSNDTVSRLIRVSKPAVDLGPIHVPGEMMTRWPVFNVADACVTSGIVLLILATFLFDRHYAAHGDSD